MKVLYIMHSHNLIYGAARSLGYILRNSYYDFDLVCSDILLQSYGEEAIMKYAGEKLKNIFYIRLPNRFSVVINESPHLFVDNVKDFLRNIKFSMLALPAYIKIRYIIQRNRYDLIHLNSIVLYPLIEKHHKYILHAREIYNGKESYRFKRKLEQLAGIINISHEVHNSLPKVSASNIELINPVDMHEILKIDINQVKMKLLNCTKDGIVVFSIIGVVSRVKGIDFVINAFKSVDNDNAKLLIVGKSPTQQYLDFCLQEAGSDSRILFINETEKIEEIYSITDYVVRADPIFAIGRTVIEGLYAGCEVILQGEAHDIDKVNVEDIYKHRIHMYKPRDKDTFISSITEGIDKKAERLFPNSNVIGYMKMYNDWMEKIADGNFYA